MHDRTCDVSSRLGTGAKAGRSQNILSTEINFSNKYKTAFTACEEFWNWPTLSYGFNNACLMRILCVVIFCLKTANVHAVVVRGVPGCSSAYTCSNCLHSSLTRSPLAIVWPWTRSWSIRPTRWVPFTTWTISDTIFPSMRFHAAHTLQ